jgi:hypothetical protein
LPDHPKAFMCHADIDTQLAARIAVDLIGQGIDVWYSGWDLLPGDSLRRTIERGIEGAENFLVLVTEAILSARWAQIELDAGFAKYVERSGRIIPIVVEIAPVQVPRFLQTIFWVPLSLERYDVGLHKIVAACHGVSGKPALGAAPSWVTATPLPDSELSPDAQRLAVLLNERSENAIPVMSYMSAEAVCKELDITPDDLALAADELRAIGWVTLSRERPTGPAGFARIRPEAHLFFATDPSLKGWHPVVDAHAVASALVNARRSTVSVADIDTVLAWGPRRLNAAVDALVAGNFAKPLDVKGTYPYAHYCLYVTPATRRFASQTL